MAMDVKREGVARKKAIKRTIIIVLTAAGGRCNQLAALEAEAGGAHGGEGHGLDRFGEARTNCN